MLVRVTCKTVVIVVVCELLLDSCRGFLYSFIRLLDDCMPLLLLLTAFLGTNPHPDCG